MQLVSKISNGSYDTYVTAQSTNVTDRWHAIARLCLAL